MQVQEQASEKEGDHPVTVLEGKVKDQAELSGILNTLYDQQLSLLSVKCLDKSDSSPTH